MGAETPVEAPRAPSSASCSAPTSAGPCRPGHLPRRRYRRGAPPPGSTEVAKARLTDLPTGRRTPLAAGIHTALALAQHQADRPLLVLLSDGRATAGPAGQDPLAAAKAAAAEVRRRKVPAVVVDAEDGPTRLGLAAELAEAIGARYLTLPRLSAASVRHLAPSDWVRRGRRRRGPGHPVSEQQRKGPGPD